MSRSRVSPVLVLALVCALPAIALGGLWRFANARAEDATLVIEAVENDDPLGALPPTPVLSLRRAPDEIARRINLGRFAAAADAVEAAVPEGSCLTITVGGDVVAERNSSSPVVPASSLKLATAAVALAILGPDHRYTTQARAEVAGGVVEGDVYLVGGGDPLLASAWYPESALNRYPPVPATRLEDLADAIVAAGVTEIRGRVVGDGTRYDDEFFAPTWSNQIRGIEAGPLDALLVNDAVLQSDGRKATDPADGAARELIRLLRERNVVVRGRSAVGQVPGETAVVAELQSAPLSEVVGEMLRTSDDNSAEMIVKELGFMTSGSGTRDSGLAVIAATLTGWGMPTEGMALVDGSGLSGENRMSCSLLRALLDRHTPTDTFGQSLSVLATSGTLSDVGVGHPLAGRLLGKTGTLTGAKALAGYVPATDGATVEFALVLNGRVADVDVSDPAVYLPVWQGLFDALAGYPSGPSVEQVRPLAAG